MKLIAPVEYIQGHLRYGHLEWDVDEPEKVQDLINKMHNNDLAAEDKLEELIYENGHIVVDDYEVDDYGSITNIEIEESEDILDSQDFGNQVMDLLDAVLPHMVSEELADKIQQLHEKVLQKQEC